VLKIYGEGNLSIFYGGRMLLNLVCFLIGYCTALLVMYVMSLGEAVHILRTVMRNSAFILAHVDQVYKEAQLYRSKAIDESSLSMREKINRKTLDRNIMREMKKAAIKGYLDQWPESFQNLLEFKDWESMIKYVEGQSRKIRRRRYD
tara:strand:- start:4206 stop:4646 length:441 start_codon:yes stop_codon:yes gene_type:complete